MTILSFKSKEDKERLYHKAKKMEEYASMIVDCLEEAGYDGHYEDSYRDNYRDSYRRMYRDEEEDSRYNYRRMK